MTESLNSLQTIQKQLLAAGWPAVAFDQPAEVLPRIFVSGIRFENDIVDYAVRNNFTHMLNVAGSFGRQHHHQTDITKTNIIYYKELDFIDSSDYDISPFLDEVADFIYNAYRDPKSKLICNCFWGVSRSVSCIIACMIKHMKFNYDDALALIKRTRPAAQPNTGFEKILRSYCKNN